MSNSSGLGSSAAQGTVAALRLAEGIPGAGRRPPTQVAAGVPVDLGGRRREPTAAPGYQLLPSLGQWRWMRW
jgi:hypothetical protein